LVLKKDRNVVSEALEDTKRTVPSRASGTRNNILFIDASNAFEKVKTQNVLLPEHIHAIVSTYRNRETKDKYSYVASLAEVRENDYNLNIPRYVDTFEEEEPVDLQAVSRQLQQLEQEIKETDATIADYCQQLEIDTPF
jgi:type I restriction enzyme M protein